MEIIRDIPVTFDAGRLAQTLHLNAGTDDARQFGTLLAEATERARPKAVCREAYVDRRGDDAVTIGGVTFHSRALRHNLEGAEKVYAYVATCGRELDEIAVRPGDYLQRFWLDAIKASALGSAIQCVSERIAHRHGPGKTATMHPGSADATVWPIEQQGLLFSLIGDVTGAIGVELTASFLMLPNKSVSGIRFPTEVDFRSCRLCRRDACPSRSAAFDPELWKALQHD